MKALKTNFKLSVVFIILLFAACTKNNDNGVNSKKYSDANGTNVTINNTDWYLTRQGGGGTVNVKFSGSTNADKITITTTGDGLQTEINIAMTSGQFTEDTGVSFTAESVPTGNFQESTTIKAYKGTDVLVIKLTSGELHY